MRLILMVFLSLLLMGLGVGQDTQQQTDQQQGSQEQLQNTQPQENQTQEDQSQEASAQTTEGEAETPASTENLNLPTLTIKRKDRDIIVAQKAPGNKGGKTFLNVNECDDAKKDSIFSTFFAPEPYLVETQVNEATLTSRIAASKQPPNKKDDEGKVIEKGGDKAILELYGGTLEFVEERGNDKRGCPINIKRSDQTDVTLKQGRTTVKGVNFIYDNNKGIGNMKGPITLDRVAEGDSPALNATSDTMEVNVDDDKTFLEGNVKVNSEDRVSEATTLEYNEEDGIAILRGDREKNIPAKSTKGSDVLQGYVIIYYLDTNDVLVEGDVQGDIEVDLEGEGTSGDASGNSPSDEPTTDTTNEP
jgi:lipopolysaccharide export system protein LptA